jgi:CHAT domain
MTGVVVEIRRNGLDGALWTSLVEPGTYSGASDFYPFAYDAADAEPTGFTNGTLGADEMGRYILAKLSGHPAVSSALTAALAAQPGTQEPVFIRVAPQAEGVPWETLFADGNFLALDPRWPIGRMNTQDSAVVGDREFRPPLRVLAVLAAAGLDASQEWIALRDALGSLPFDVTVRVLAAQDGLRAAVQTGNPVNLAVTAEFVEPGLDLPGQITGFRPNILHFFCHGGVAVGSSFLEIATRGTAGSPRGGVSFELKDFPAAHLADDLWLVVVNACKGALPPAGTASLVSSLAARGVPAVAGMREAVTADDAYAFCRGFYGALAEMLTPLAESTTPVPIAWCAALYRARREICELHRGPDPCAAAAARFREWTLPVMYVRRTPFTLYRAQTAKHLLPPAPLPPERRTALESQLQVLRDLSARQLGAPSDVLAAYRERIQVLEFVLGG